MDVQSLVDDAVFVHADAALALHDAVGDDPPHIDLDEGRAVYVETPGRLSFEIQALGIEYSDGGEARGSAASPLESLFGVDPQGEWVWAWSRPDIFPPHLLGLAERVREIGERHGLDDLAAERVPLGELSAAHLVIAAKTISGRVASIVVPGPEGTRVHLMLDLRPQTPGARQAAAAITTALRQGLVADHRRALASYARIADLPVHERRDGLELIAPDGRLDIALDDLGRIVRVATPDVDEPESGPPALAAGLAGARDATADAAAGVADDEVAREPVDELFGVSADGASGASRVSGAPGTAAGPGASAAPNRALAPRATEGPIAPMPVLRAPASPPSASADEVAAEAAPAPDAAELADALLDHAVSDDTIVLRLTAADRRALREGRLPSSMAATAPAASAPAREMPAPDAPARTTMPRRVALGSMPRLAPRAGAGPQ